MSGEKSPNLEILSLPPPLFLSLYSPPSPTRDGGERKKTVGWSLTFLLDANKNQLEAAIGILGIFQLYVWAHSAHFHAMIEFEFVGKSDTGNTNWYSSVFQYLVFARYNKNLRMHFNNISSEKTDKSFQTSFQSKLNSGSLYRFKVGLKSYLSFSKP